MGDLESKFGIKNFMVRGRLLQSIARLRGKAGTAVARKSRSVSIPKIHDMNGQQHQQQQQQLQQQQQQQQLSPAMATRRSGSTSAPSSPRMDLKRAPGSRSPMQHGTEPYG